MASPGHTQGQAYVPEYLLNALIYAPKFMSF